MTDGTTDSGADERARRAERRAFIRSAHPDLGGDPDAFISGLARLDGGRTGHRAGSPAGAGRPSVHRSRRPDRVVRQFVRQLRRRLSGSPPRNLR